MPRAAQLVRRLRGPLFALILLVLLLVGLEFLARAKNWGTPPADVLRVPGQRVPDTALTLWDPDLVYVLRPGAVMFGRYRINGLGYRGPEVTRERLPATLRVACLGDSSTFGLGVSDEETWPFQLERLLDGLLEGVLAAECLNGGVPGYSTEQNKRQLITKLMPLRPDLVVACPTAQNDTSLRDNDGDAAVLDENTALMARIEQLHLARLLGIRRSDASFRADGQMEPGQPGARARCTPEEFAENLEIITATAREAGLPVVTIVTPHSPALVARLPDLGASEQLVLDLAARHGALAVDVRDEFQGFEPLPMFSDGIHFVPLGQQLIAIGTAEALIDTALLQGLGPRSAFLQAWRDGRRSGLLQPLPTLAVFGDTRAPPRLRALVQAALNAPLDDEQLVAALAAGRSFPKEFLLHDPLVGSRRSPYGTGALLLSEARAREAGQMLIAQHCAAQRAEIETHVYPADALLRWAGGAEQLQASTPPRLALLRGLTAFDAAIGATPRPTDRRVSRGIAALIAGRAQEALDDLQAALLLNPRHSEARYQSAFALRRLGRNPEAVLEFQALVAKDPESALGQFITGLLLKEADDPAGAEPYLRRAIQLDGTLSRARYLLGRLLMDRGELDEAEEQLTIAAMIMTDPVDAFPLLREIRAKRAATPAAPPP
ncbi:MAG: tetratricopeptide repeat protein [Planctomycetota bacterium]